jgi:hypothetical protein
MLLKEGFLGWVFFGIGSTSIHSTVIAGQTEGLRVGFKEWVYGWAEDWVDRWAEGWI